MGLLDSYLGADTTKASPADAVDPSIEGQDVYIFESIEWHLTGRTATRPVFHPRKPTQQIGNMVVVEVKPLRSNISDPSLTRWVDPRDLFFVEQHDPKDIDLDELKELNVYDDVSGNSRN